MRAQVERAYLEGAVIKGIRNLYLSLNTGIYVGLATGFGHESTTWYTVRNNLAYVVRRWCCFGTESTIWYILREHHALVVRKIWRIIKYKSDVR